MQNEETIFEAAVQKPNPAERAAYLEGACGGDPDLHRRVEALVRAHQQSGGLLDSSANDVGSITAAVDAPLHHPPIIEGPGARIGPYKLLQLIGAGGMGVVYVAEQTEPVRRRVSLKIIKGDGLPPGHRPVRGRAAVPGHNGPPEHRQGPRRRRDGDGNLLTTLGVAYYRAGNHKKALNTFLRSDAINKTQHWRARVANLAFLAMTHQQLGHAKEAQAELERLRESERLKEDPRWEHDTQAQGFLREAEALLAKPRAPGSK